MTAHESEQIGILIGKVDGVLSSQKDLWQKMDEVNDSVTRTTLLCEQHETKIAGAEKLVRKAILIGVGVLIAGHAGSVGVIKMLEVLVK